MIERVPQNKWSWLAGTLDSGRQWIKNMDVDLPILNAFIKEKTRKYVRLVLEKHPNLTHIRYSVLKSGPGIRSQYEGCGRELHSDYSREVEYEIPDDRPVSMIIALDEFEFVYLQDRNHHREQLRIQKIYPLQMIVFTNYCLHAGGANPSNKECIRIFAYMVSNPAHLPINSISYYKWDGKDAEHDQLMEVTQQRTDNTSVIHRTRSGRYVKRVIK